MNVVMRVVTPVKRFKTMRVTKAELDSVNKKDAGYMMGVMENLQKHKSHNCDAQNLFFFSF